MHLARGGLFLPSKHEGFLLSLLRKHRFRRGPSLQVHSHILTSGSPLHHKHLTELRLLLWNTLLRHYSLGFHPQEAIFLYRHMAWLRGSPASAQPNAYTYSFALKACANMAGLGEGAQVHAVVAKKGCGSHVYVQTALVNMYLECGSVRDALNMFDEMPERNLVTWNVVVTGLTKWGEVRHARLVFDRMPEKNVVSWTGMVDGYTRASRPVEALVLFREMLVQGVSPTEVTVLAVAPAVSNLRALVMAESVHVLSMKKGIDVADVRIGNVLVDLYAKCGSIRSSWSVFNGMCGRRNLVSWTSMISGFAMHGLAGEAVRMFERMVESNYKPNEVTFLCILNACSHGGLVEEGMRFFADMLAKHGTMPGIKHYGCVVDMLGRVGRLREAESLLLEMPIETNSILWRTLLGCCNMHGDVEMGERVMRRIMELERGYGGDYVLLSNMLVSAGRFGDAEGVRRAIDGRSVSKLTGHSLS